MNTEPYNRNEELAAMKEDIASRHLGVKMKTIAITVGGIAVGLGLAAVALPALGATALIIGAGGGLWLGAKAADIATMRDRTTLSIDEQMTQSYMSGKNHWGAGYREEVAERGYGFHNETPHHGGVPHTKPDNKLGRN